jgi:hypothetical protein
MTRSEFAEAVPGLMEEIQLVEEETPGNEFNTLPDRITEATRNDEDAELRRVLISLKQGPGVVQ